MNIMAYCGKCGTQLSEGAKFCPKCGNPCGNSSSQSLEGDGFEKLTKKQKVPTKAILAVCLAIAIICGGWFVWKSLGNSYSLEGLAKAIPNYDQVYSFHEGMAIVEKGDCYGYIDLQGNEVIPCKYKSFGEEASNDFYEGLAFVSNGEKYGFIDKTGKEVIPFIYDYGSHFSEGLALVHKDGKVGYIDKTGKVVIPFNYAYAFDFSEGLAAVTKDSEKYGFIDTSGNLIVDYKYINNDHQEMKFHDGIAAVCKDEGWGYIDKSGKEITSFKYEFASDFSEGLAGVYIDGSLGFIDKEGKEIIPFVWDCWTAIFKDGVAVVEKDEKYYLIDKKNNQLCAINDGYGMSEGLMITSTNENGSYKNGFIDKYGKEVIPCIYDSAESFSDGLARVVKDGMCGFVDKNGNSTFDIKDEDVDKIVQAKIREKEEEEARIAEENKPMNKFYNIASSGEYVWESDGYGADFRHGIITILFFYPSNKGGGRITYLNIPKDRNGYYAGFSQKGVYSISDDFISSTINGRAGWTGEWTLNLNFVIENYGDGIRLKRLLQNGKETTYSQKHKSIKDPYN